MINYIFNAGKKHCYLVILLLVDFAEIKLNKEIVYLTDVIVIFSETLKIYQIYC